METIQARIKDKTLVVFDGTCSLCDNFVNWIIANDLSENIILSASSDEKARYLLNVAGKMDYTTYDALTSTTIVVMDQNKVVHIESEAFIAICRSLGGWLVVIALVLSIIPRSFRDICYRIVSRHRYSVFGRKELCSQLDSSKASKYL